MAKLRLIHRCTECGASHPKWSGRCPSCGAWNSLVEDVEGPEDVEAPFLPPSPASVPMPIAEVDALVAQPRPTGIDELDRVLGGGLVPGSVTLLGGEPGVGKSTLLLQLLAAWPGRTLYVSAEESAQQVRLRAQRLDAVRPDLFLQAETQLPHVLGALDQVAPELVVVDSIQTIADPELGSAPGSIAQVRTCAHRLVQEAKRRNLPIVLVGHVTKDGGLAGPRVLEHVVDTVLSFDGDRDHALRLLRATKHRFGPTDELGLFEMHAAGLRGVPDPSALFLADRRIHVPGSAIVATIEGHRPLLVEVQALTTPSPEGVPPRRSAQGVDSSRLALLMAVLARRTGITVPALDVYASVVGGVRITEPGLDLGLALALASAIVDQAVPHMIVAIGEVGLAGELRQVGQMNRRLGEAARLGYQGAIVPERAGHVVIDGLTTLPVSSLDHALRVAGLVG